MGGVFVFTCLIMSLMSHGTGLLFRINALAAPRRPPAVARNVRPLAARLRVQNAARPAAPHPHT